MIISELGVFIMDSMVEKLAKKINVIGGTLADFSRTYWDGLDGEELLILLDQEQHPTANNDLYTLEEVAEILSMSVVTIRQYVRMKKLNAIKKWRNWMVNSNEIARLIYEKKTGKEINPRTTMLTIIDASINEEDMSIMSINKYKILSPDDVADISGDKLDHMKINAYQHLFENAPVGTNFIEIVSSIPDFFRKTGDVSIPQNTDAQHNLANYQIKQNIIDNILQQSSELINSETPLTDLEKLFGNQSDKTVLLKVYRTMLYFAVKNEQYLSNINSLTSYIKELESKIEEEGK